MRFNLHNNGWGEEKNRTIYLDNINNFITNLKKIEKFSKDRLKINNLNSYNTLRMEYKFSHYSTFAINIYMHKDNSLEVHTHVTENCDMKINSISIFLNCVEKHSLLVQKFQVTSHHDEIKVKNLSFYNEILSILNKNKIIISDLESFRYGKYDADALRIWLNPLPFNLNEIECNLFSYTENEFRQIKNRGYI